MFLVRVHNTQQFSALRSNGNQSINFQFCTIPAILQNRCYSFALLFLSFVLLSFRVDFVVRWFDGTFAKQDLWVRLSGFANVPSIALGYVTLISYLYSKNSFKISWSVSFIKSFFSSFVNSQTPKFFM